MRGPVPKRAEERRRRNSEPSDQVTVEGGRAPAPQLRDGINPMAAAWYESLQDSGQAKFYEPSDWMMAQLIAEAIDAFVTSRTASLLPPILAGATNLLATEGDRRRMRLELTRAVSDEDEVAAVALLDEYRERLS